METQTGAATENRCDSCHGNAFDGVVDCVECLKKMRAQFRTCSVEPKGLIEGVLEKVKSLEHDGVTVGQLCVSIVPPKIGDFTDR